MKKSKLVSCVFNSYFLLFFCGSVFSQEISLDGRVNALDYDKLEKISERRDGVFNFYSGQSFKVSLGGGRVYYLASTTTLWGVKPVEHGYPGGRGYCEFNFYNTKYEFVSGIRVNIKDHADANVCNWIWGVSAVVYKKQPALLATVQYHRGINPAKTVNEIGKGYHDFTALLVLDPHPDGSLAIRQDDECLGALNQIGELAVAKKRLAECSQ
jgi:hypothetical protein